MSLPRSWYKSAVLLTLTIALTLWACGDGGGPTEPTSTQQAPVASVTVAPVSATADVSQTQQFTATLQDASGNTLTGRTVAWSSSNESVATVNQTGLVSATGPGEVTITATSEGRSGTGALTVTEPLPPGVEALGTIGADGGSIETPDVGLTIAAGQLSAPAQIQILSDDDPMAEFGSDGVTETFRLQGFPQDREVEVRVRLRTTAPLREQTYIGMGVPVVRSSTDTFAEESGLVLREATDSAGYIVATLSVRGRGTSSAPSPLPSASADGADGLADGRVGGVTGVKSDSVPGGRWVVLSWGAPRTELDPLVSRAAELMENSQDAVEALGYSVSHRTSWPMEIHVYPTNEFSGAFEQRPPWPLDVNTSFFHLDAGVFGRSDAPATAIHEFFHFAQTAFTKDMSEDEQPLYGWIMEAGSTWIEEKAPDATGPFDIGLVQSQRNDLFLGLYPSLDINDGYGKAPIMKYVADRWGTDQVLQIWTNVGNKEPAVDAVLKAIPETAATWWPDLLTKYMKGEIYSLDPDSLPPRTGGNAIFDPGNFTWGANTTLRPMGAEFLLFKPTENGYGTGTKFTVRIPPDFHDAGFRILPFRKDSSGKWEEFGGVADSLVINGADLNLGRQFGFYLIHTTPSSPYTESWELEYETDIGYADGDWYVENTEVLSDAITYSRPSQDDTVTVDVVGDTELIITFMASGGIWRRTEDDPNHYIWEATAEFATQLADLNATASSEARVIQGDSLRLKAEFDFNPPASTAGGSGNPVALGGACLLLLAGLAMRRKRQMVMVAYAGAFGLALWGCSIAFINLSFKYRYDFTFSNAALTASLADPQIPMVRLDNGTGTVFVDRHRSEFWQYVEDAQGNKTDSVAVVRTASGQATVKLDATLVQDGAFDEEEGDIEAMLRASGHLKGPITALPEAIRARIRR